MPAAQPFLIMNTKRTGTAMIFLSCILGMVVLTFFFSETEKERYNPNRDPKSRVSAHNIEIKLERNFVGHYIANGTINRYPVAFLLDTGATDVVVPASIADKLNLKKGRAGRAMTANGAITVFETNIDHLSLGEINLYNVRASINPSMPSSNVLLGMSALGRIEFVQDGTSLTLIQKSF